MTAPTSDLTNAPIFADAPKGEGREYEFNDAENKVFAALHGGMRFVGGAHVVTGALLVVIAAAHVWMGGPPALISAVPMALTAAILSVVGLWLRTASRSVEQIVSTKGSDIANLMRAMTELTKMFALERAYFLAAGVVGGFVVAGGVVAWAFFADAVRRVM